MGVITGNMSSEILGMKMNYTAILPEQLRGPYPVLYLLHGRSDDDKAWLYNTSLVRYAASKKLAIIMPQVHLSYYTDMKTGGDYWTFLTEEFPKKMKHQFHISTSPAETFVAGLSMGGYGALKWGLSYPDQVAGIAALSAATDVFGLWERDASREKSFSAIFGSKDELKDSANDLLAVLEAAKEKEPLPAVLQICGTEDFLYKDNLIFKGLIEQMNVDYTFMEGSGGHDWDFWDKRIQDVLEWIEGMLKGTSDRF